MLIMAYESRFTMTSQRAGLQYCESTCNRAEIVISYMHLDHASASDGRDSFLGVPSYGHELSRMT